MAEESRGDSPEPTSDQDEMRPNYSNRGYEQRRNSLPIQNKNNKPPPFKKMMMKKKKRSNAWSICSLTGLVIVLLIISAYLLVKYQKEIEAQVNKFQEPNDTKMPSVFSDEQTAVDKAQEITPKEKEKNTNTTTNTDTNTDNDTDTDTDNNANTIINTNTNIKKDVPVENNSPDAQGENQINQNLTTKSESIPRHVNIELNNNEAETKKPKPPKKDPPKLPSNPTSVHLFQAIDDNDVDMAEALIKAGVNLNDFKDGYNTLHYAAGYLRADIMRFILESGKENIDIEATLQNQEFPNFTAIHVVAMNAGTSENTNAVDSAKVLIEYGASLDTLAADNYTPLCLAVMLSTNASFIQLLIDNGSDPNYIEKTQNYSPLHYAMVKCDEAVIETLLKNHASTKASNAFLREPIHEAAFSGCVDGLRLLIRSGVEKNARSPSKDPEAVYQVPENEIFFGSTPLHYAAYNGHDKAVEYLLLYHFATPIVKNDRGSTTADLAARNNHDSTEQLIIHYHNLWNDPDSNLNYHKNSSQKRN